MERLPQAVTHGERQQNITNPMRAHPQPRRPDPCSDRFSGRLVVLGGLTKHRPDLHPHMWPLDPRPNHARSAVVPKPAPRTDLRPTAAHPPEPEMPSKKTSYAWPQSGRAPVYGNPEQHRAEEGDQQDAEAQRCSQPDPTRKDENDRWNLADHGARQPTPPPHLAHPRHLVTRPIRLRPDRRCAHTPGPHLGSRSPHQLSRELPARPPRSHRPANRPSP